MNSPALIRDLCQTCIEAVERSVGVSPDYTPDTLALLDHYATLEADPSEEVLALLAPMCGAYFGEVVRRHFLTPAWKCEGDHYAEYALAFTDLPLSFNPLGIALEVLSKTDAPGWNAHFEVPKSAKPHIESALKGLGEFEAEDYHRFTLRFEAIEEAYLVLGKLKQPQA